MKTFLSRMLLFFCFIPYIPPTCTVGFSSTFTVCKVGDTFQLNVVVNNVADLYGYQLTVVYDTERLRVVDMGLPLKHFLTPNEEANIFVVRLGVEDSGAVCAVTLLTVREPAKTGSGVLLTISFEVVKSGFTWLRLEGVILGTPEAEVIHCTTDNHLVVVR